MLKKYEVAEIIKNALLELDGIVSNKPDEYGNYEIYFVDIKEDENELLLTFQTISGKNTEVDKYRITVDYVK